MSREIKFRVWDKYLKCFFLDIDPRDGFFSIDGCPVFSTECESGDYLDFDGSFKDNFVFQQLVGTKDKKGQEAYEGDIVKYGQLNYEIIWNEFQWSVVCPNYRKFNWPTILPHYIKCGKIIGNILENPELLAKKS
jgi:hypothetical protein